MFSFLPGVKESSISLDFHKYIWFSVFVSIWSWLVWGSSWGVIACLLITAVTDHFSCICVSPLEKCLFRDVAHFYLSMFCSRRFCQHILFILYMSWLYHSKNGPFNLIKFWSKSCSQYPFIVNVHGIINNDPTYISGMSNLYPFSRLIILVRVYWFYFFL